MILHKIFLNTSLFPEIFRDCSGIVPGMFRESSGDLPVIFPVMLLHFANVMMDYADPKAPLSPTLNIAFHIQRWGMNREIRCKRVQAYQSDAPKDFVEGVQKAVRG